jgi:hypothetical protein
MSNRRNRIVTLLRKANTSATSRHGVAGVPKTKARPKPITLAGRTKPEQRVDA